MLAVAWTQAVVGAGAVCFRPHGLGEDYVQETALLQIQCLSELTSKFDTSRSCIATNERVVCRVQGVSQRRDTTDDMVRPRTTT